MHSLINSLRHSEIRRVLLWAKRRTSPTRVHSKTSNTIRSWWIIFMTPIRMHSSTHSTHSTKPNSKTNNIPKTCQILTSTHRQWLKTSTLPSKTTNHTIKIANSNSLTSSKMRTTEVLKEDTIRIMDSISSSPSIRERCSRTINTRTSKSRAQYIKWLRRVRSSSSNRMRLIRITRTCDQVCWWIY